jgi:AcrR family transcriptional regulator
MATGSVRAKNAEARTEVGTSTMAVYTYFGGMGQLITEVVREGYLWFGQRLAEVPRGDDPVTDLLALGMAYRGYALENHELYRLMFGASALEGRRAGNGLSMAAAAERRFRARCPLHPSDRRQPAGAGASQRRSASERVTGGHASGEAQR